MLKAIAELSPQLGRQIPLSDKLNEFKNAITRLTDLNDLDISLALLGFDLNAIAREKKETFMSAIRHLISSLDDILALDTYKAHSAMFTRIKSAASDLLRVIDQFSDVVKKKYG